MTFLEPGVREVQKEMEAVAAVLERKAREVREFATSIGEVTEEEFARTFGDQYAGPAQFRQWSEVVTKATTARPSETSGFERALTEAFAACQRDAAAKPALAAVERAYEKGQSEA